VSCRPFVHVMGLQKAVQLVQAFEEYTDNNSIVSRSHSHFLIGFNIITTISNATLPEESLVRRESGKQKVSDDERSGISEQSWMPSLMCLSVWQLSQMIKCFATIATLCTITVVVSFMSSMSVWRSNNVGLWEHVYIRVLLLREVNCFHLGQLSTSCGVGTGRSSPSAEVSSRSSPQRTPTIRNQFLQQLQLFRRRITASYEAVIRLLHDEQLSSDKTASWWDADTQYFGLWIFWKPEECLTTKVSAVVVRDCKWYAAEIDKDAVLPRLICLHGIFTTKRF